MENLITCEKCSRQWDGYAQCPCGICCDSSEEDTISEITGEGIKTLITELNNYLFINKQEISPDIYNKILDDLLKIYKLV